MRNARPPRSLSRDYRSPGARRSEGKDTMTTLWFLLVAIMLVAYIVFDGFDLGVGAIYKLAARTPDERAAVRRSIGPVWDANEVWLRRSAVRDEVDSGLDPRRRPNTTSGASGCRRRREVPGF